MFAKAEPDAPISRPIIWLVKAVGGTAFIFIYLAVMGAIACVLLWGIQICDYERFKKATKPVTPTIQ
jgi:cytochrome b